MPQQGWQQEWEDPPAPAAAQGAAAPAAAAAPSSGAAAPAGCAEMTEITAEQLMCVFPG